jgi:hypothetical protein
LRYCYSVIAKTYEWISVDVTDTSASGDTVFVFDPANTDASAIIGSDIDIHIANSVNTDFGF